MNLKNKRGITIIALVITIIVLLILAGIAISVLTGENGLFARAKTSTVKYNEESAKEKANMLMSEFVIDNTTQGITLEEFLNEKKKLVIYMM